MVAVLKLCDMYSIELYIRRVTVYSTDTDSVTLCML